MTRVRKKISNRLDQDVPAKQFDFKVNSGGRLSKLEPEAFTQEQINRATEIAKSYNGKIDGPHSIWFRVPELSKLAADFNTWIRLHGHLERRLFDLIVLIIARRHNAQFEWYVHERSAIRSGVSKEVVEDLRMGRKLKLIKHDEHLILKMVTDINEHHTLDLRTYKQALAFFGEELLIEIITDVGFYTMVAMMCNVFDAPLPEGEAPRLNISKKFK